MIGSYIKGTDLIGQPCEGIILDKLLCLQTVGMHKPGHLGGAVQTIPVALDAYLVKDDAGGLHLVPPLMISYHKPMRWIMTKEVYEELQKKGLV